MADSNPPEDTPKSNAPPSGSPAGAEKERAAPMTPVVLLAGLGLTLSLVLEFIHARTYLVPTADSFCSMGATFDCVSVAASPHSVILGLPWSIWGSLGFLTLMTAGLKRSVWLLPLAGFAAIISLGLFIVSLTQVGSLCLLCEAVHLTSWLLLVFAWLRRKELHGSFTDLSDITSIFAFPVGAAIALQFVIPAYWGSFSYKADPPFATGVTPEGHHWIGAEDPDFTFEEFTDYRCPHCKIASTRSLRMLAEHKNYRLVRRQQPRMKCPTGRDSACRAARLAYCSAQQGKFWRADRWLFATADPRKEIDVESMITDLDLDGRALKACFSSEEAFTYANSEHRAAQKKKLIEVPGYVVDGKKYLPSEFDELLKSR